MPSFSYRAYDAKGALVNGVLSAESRDAALEALARRGVYPLDLGVGEVAPADETPWWQREVFSLSSGQLPPAELTIFTRELATLIKAELPTDEALRIVALQPTVGSRTRAAARAALGRVMEGKSLSEALALAGPAFPEIYWRTVAAGEASATLGTALEDLARYLERGGEIRAKLVSALIYPAILLAAAAVAVGVVMAVLLPTIAPLFKDAGKDPPAMIRLLLDTQSWLAANWVQAMAVLAAYLVGLLLILRNGAVRLSVDRAALRLPIAGTLIGARETARFTRTLATLMRSGVPMLEAMRVAGGVLGNRAFASAVREAADEVKEGSTLSAPLLKSGVFSELAMRLVSVGERTGQLETMLMRTAEIYEDSLQRQLLRLTGLVTPVLTIVIGVVVGGLILSVMGAIVSVNELAIR
jgi:general secretion pathway protein F